MSPLLEVNSVTKDFYPPLSFRKLLKFDFKPENPVRALEDVSFTLEKGRVLRILGPNGSGKTTLLKIISGLILPDCGSVTVNGYSVATDGEKIKPIIGLASSSERSFYLRLTGRQNLEFFAALYGLDRKTARARIESLFIFFEVDYQDRRFDSYSAGMQQKFSLIRALLHDPSLIMIDEPTKSLDYKTALNMRRLIKEKLIKEQGRTVIFTTHHMDEALDLAEYLMIMHRGKILACGTLDELRNIIKKPDATVGEIFLKLTCEG